MTATIINVKDDMVYYTSNNEEYSIELSTISRMFNRKNIFEPVDLKPIKIHINEISDKLIDRVRQRKDSKGRSVDFDTALTKLDTARIVAALKKVPPLERENAYKEILAYNPIVRASEHETNIPNQIYSIRNKIKRDLQAEFPEIAKSVSLDYIFLFFFYIHTTLLLIPSTLYLL